AFVQNVLNCTSNPNLKNLASQIFKSKARNAEPMNILIVDDNPTNLKLLRAQLEGEGHAIIQAADGIEALGMLAREKVDAIISDILMPRMDGYRLCNEIRKD